MTENECLEKLRRGGKARAEAISYLYREHARRFLGYFMKHRVPRERAEELVQEVFVKIVRYCENFRGETRFDSWMWAIVRNELMDHFRRQKPEEATEEEDLERLAEEAMLVEIPSDPGAGLEDCVQKAYAAFAKAYADRAEMLARVVFDGWSIDDVAAALKRTSGATREYLSQCRKKLKQFLEPCREYLEAS
jgi:RNA polymerase sigma-70 factor (ECF subfamily)